MSTDHQSLVVVSNRLPIVLDAQPNGRRFTRGSGGLVTALEPVLAARDGRWIGWLGRAGLATPRRVLDEAERELGYRLNAVDLDGDEVAGYYRGYSNQVLWPLFHDQTAKCRFCPAYWPIYEQVNRKFARAIAEHSGPDDLVWVQDYHLMRVAAALREAGVERRLAFFLHIPFPSRDLFLTLPARELILDGLLEYSMVGFQSDRDLENFVQCVRSLRPHWPVRGFGGTRRLARPDGDERVLAVTPISIDAEQFQRRAARHEVSAQIAAVRERLGEQRIILGLDRLDYSKGIPERLEAFALTLERHPELRGQVTLLQFVIPSRTGVDEYQALKERIDQQIGAINARFGEAGWAPVQYLYRSLGEVELLAYYRMADVALVTPLKDGMNLVAKEYCACNIADDGVLILSEFAGAADELGPSSLLVNPHDVEQTSSAIHRALTMERSERRERMRQLRRSVCQRDIYAWLERFLELLPAPSRLISPPAAVSAVG